MSTFHHIASFFFPHNTLTLTMTLTTLLFLFASSLISSAHSVLLVVENGLEPWPSGHHGEQPPPVGSLVRLDNSGTRHVVKSGLIDPVWVVATHDGLYAYVGLFHSGQIVRISLVDGNTTMVAKGLSCPEGVALDNNGSTLFVVENPVGDECQATFPLKHEAQLTRVNLKSGEQTKICSLRSSSGGEEGGPHGLAVQGDYAYVCDCPENYASLTRVDISSGEKYIITNLTSPSGCAVSGNFAYVVEQGATSGALVRVSLPSPSSPAGSKKVLLEDLAGPMGVAVDASLNIVYVEERHKNQVRSMNLSSDISRVFATGLNSPIGLAVV
jgi:DNA-binding beta-propeller fold protein YncE